MRDEFFYHSAEFRNSVIVNAVWQFIAQFSRRYAQDYFFSFEQIHPGSSVGGLLEVKIHEQVENTKTRKFIGVLQFHIGGPNRGSLMIGTASNPVSHSVEVGKNGLVKALLSTNYAQFYEQTALMLGLPGWHMPLPQANRFAISMQFISIIQNALAVYPFEFRPTCGSYGHSLSYTGEVADFHRKWAYQYFDEELLPGVDFVGRTDEEINRLLTILPFDDYTNDAANFVLHTSEARIRIKLGASLSEHIDIAKLYRQDRTRFFELAASLAFSLSKQF